MMDMDVLEAIVSDSLASPLPELVTRELRLPDLAGRATVLTGMRRSGKTYMLYQEMERLTAQGVDRHDLLLVNFEDDRLHPLDSDAPARALEAFFRLNPEARTRRSYLFFDEIQNVPGWPRFVRRVLDTENARVYLTGSSAKLLSTEVATEMRGRGQDIEVLPFSFAESAVLHGIDLPLRLPPDSRTRSRFEAHLSDYLHWGGFPEVLRQQETDRLRTLQGYVELVILRDVLERHRLENVTAVRTFARILLQNVGRPFSVNKSYNDLKSRGVAVSKDTLHALTAHFADAFLAFTVPVFRKSERARATRPRKVYAIDPGLARAMSHVAAGDVGPRLENAVYLQLRRRRHGLLEGGISYYMTAGGREVDFVVGDPFEGIGRELIQVSATIADPATRDRELRTLAEAMDELGLREASIVTLFEQETIELASGTVRVVPAWRWLLEEDDSSPAAR
jgi:predicted AAA+ superfamily ATPase